jgi:uncharacterized protein
VRWSTSRCQTLPDDDHSRKGPGGRAHRDEGPRARAGDGDEVAVLQRERKKRLEAADAYQEGGRGEQADVERGEAELIEAYLPEQLSDEELGELVTAAIEETGATEQKQMGQVMSAVMPKVGGRADGKRVSQVVRDKLGA